MVVLEEVVESEEDETEVSLTMMGVIFYVSVLAKLLVCCLLSLLGCR